MGKKARIAWGPWHILRFLTVKNVSLEKVLEILSIYLIVSLCPAYNQAEAHDSSLL